MIEKFPRLALLSQLFGKPIVFYDFETTAFASDPTLGIVEAGYFMVDGTAGTTEFHGTLVNPENPIGEGATKVHGITQDMVDGLPNWVGSGLAEKFAWFTKNAILSGYNNSGFDDKVLQLQSERYGVELGAIESFDIRQWHANANNLPVAHVKGKLTEILETYQVKPHDVQAHRVEGDVMNTAMLAELLVDRILKRGIGIQNVFSIHTSTSAAPANPNSNDLKIDRTRAMVSILERVEKISEEDLVQQATELRKEFAAKRDYAFLLGDIIRGNRVYAEKLADEESQAYLAEVLPGACEKVWEGGTSGQLKPMLQFLEADADANNKKKLNYTQLRIAQLRLADQHAMEASAARSGMKM